MNDELQKQIAEILKQALAAAQHGGQWLAGQIPDVLQQLILWNIWCGIISGIIFLMILSIGLIVTFKVTDQKLVEVSYGKEWAISKIVSCFIFGVSSLVSLIAFLINLPDALKAAIAPKLFLLEYAVHLVH